MEEVKVMETMGTAAVVNAVDVKEAVETGTKASSFVTAQGVDGSAAFQRMSITKRMLEEYQAAINATNTADIIGSHRKLYDDFETVARAIIREEQLLVSMGA